MIKNEYSVRTSLFYCKIIQKVLSLSSEEMSRTRAFKSNLNSKLIEILSTQRLAAYLDA